MFEQDAQQAELAAGEWRDDAIGRSQYPCCCIQTPAGKAQAACWFGAQIGRQGAGATQDGLDARQQLARIEGFDQIIVGAHFDADDAIGFLAAGGQHQHRHGAGGRLAAQIAAQGQAVGIRQHQVEHDQVDDMAFQHLPHFAAVTCRQRGKAIARQIIDQQAADAGIVIDDQNVVGFLHDFSVSTLSAAYFTRLTQRLCNIVLQIPLP